MKGLITIIFITISFSLSAQTAGKLIREGNKQYQDKKYTDAEISYRKAIDKKNNSFEASFNTANTLYKQGKYPEATAMFDTLTRSQKDKNKLAKIYYNLGNSYIKGNKINEAINAYKSSLKNNPKDEDAKFNLSYAYKLLKKQQDQNKQNQQDKNNKDNKNNKDKQNQQNKDQNKQDNKDKNKDQQNKDQQNKDQQNKDQQNKDQQNKDQQNKDQQNNQNQDQKQGKGGKQISPEAAQQILDAIQNDEKNVQQRLNNQKKQQGENVQVIKNW